MAAPVDQGPGAEWRHSNKVHSSVTAGFGLSHSCDHGTIHQTANVCTCMLLRLPSRSRTHVMLTIEPCVPCNSSAQIPS